jgi:hypothetical protein
MENLIGARTIPGNGEFQNGKSDALVFFRKFPCPVRAATQHEVVKNRGWTLLDADDCC